MIPEMPKENNASQESGQTEEETLFDLRAPESKLLDPVWIKSQSDEELLEAILRLFLELRARMASPTMQGPADDDTVPPTLLQQQADGLTTVKISPESASLTFVETDVERYRRLPIASTKKLDEQAETTWRIALFNPNLAHKPLGLEIYDEIIIGRASGGITPDLDLTDYDAVNLGMSRQHARLKPTKDGLYLTDLGSTNGTFCNGTKLKIGDMRKLENGDTISFGKVHFMMTVVAQPGE
jgi:hypothetical protein